MPACTQQHGGNGREEKDSDRSVQFALVTERRQKRAVCACDRAKDVYSHVEIKNSKPHTLIRIDHQIHFIGDVTCHRRISQKSARY